MLCCQGPKTKIKAELLAYEETSQKWRNDEYEREKALQALSASILKDYAW
jgi:hypothetical protein